LALFYLDQFDHDHLLALAAVTTNELAKLLANGRQQFQAWMNMRMPEEGV
jgi:phage anti-repressor protein